MSNIWNPHAFGVTGQPVGPQTNALRVYGAEPSKEQLAMAQQAFAKFCMTERLSFAANQTQQGFLPDGSKYRIVVVGNTRIMEVRVEAEKQSFVLGCVYLHTTRGNMFDVSAPVHRFIFRAVGGGVVYEHETLEPYSENHPGMKPVPFYYLGPDQHLAFYDIGKIGVVGVPEYFFWHYPIIGRQHEVFKDNVYSGQSPRKYGEEYIMFNVGAENITQDDGVVVFETDSDHTIMHATFHPNTPNASLILFGIGASSTAAFESVTSYADAPPYNPVSDTATYTPVLQLASFPTYTIERKELARLPSGVWEETGSVDVPAVAEQSGDVIDYHFVDYYLNTVQEITGLVEFRTDTPVFRRVTASNTSGEGTCLLEASYAQNIESVENETFGNSGEFVSIRGGYERSLDFTGSADVNFHLSNGLTTYSTNYSYTATNKRWSEFDGKRFYHIDSTVVFSQENSAVPTNLLFIGEYDGSLTMSVECQRRSLLKYDPSIKFLAYIEEAPFSYTWNANAHCDFMMGNDENAHPHSEEVPLEGEGDMVTVGQPVLFLVMEINGIEVLRESIQISQDVHQLRLEMIPVTSIYLQPEVDSLPPPYISVEEYKKRMRTLLCTNYLCGFSKVNTVYHGEGGSTEEYRLRFRPSGDDGKLLDDFFLRLGSFYALASLECEYITDAGTGAGMLLIKQKTGEMEFPASLFVASASGVQKVAQPGGGWGQFVTMTAN